MQVKSRYFEHDPSNKPIEVVDEESYEVGRESPAKVKQHSELASISLCEESRSDSFSC